MVVNGAMSICCSHLARSLGGHGHGETLDFRHSGQVAGGATANVVIPSEKCCMRQVRYDLSFRVRGLCNHSFLMSITEVGGELYIMKFNCCRRLGQRCVDIVTRRKTFRHIETRGSDIYLTSLLRGWKWSS